MKTYIEFFILVLKIIISIKDALKNRSDKEVQLLEERMRLIASIFEKALTNAPDIFDEEVYFKNIAWEEKTRYLSYKVILEDIFESGEGWSRIKVESKMGFGERAKKHETTILSILRKNFNSKEKAQLIARLVAS